MNRWVAGYGPRHLQLVTDELCQWVGLIFYRLTVYRPRPSLTYFLCIVSIAAGSMTPMTLDLI